jgi:hypothetical protein
MSGTTPGTGGSHYNPDEPRDWHGRWTTGGSSWRDTPLGDPGAAGRARTLLGHARVGAWQKGVLSDVAWPTPAEAARFSRLLAAWNAAPLSGIPGPPQGIERHHSHKPPPPSAISLLTPQVDRLRPALPCRSPGVGRPRRRDRAAQYRRI